jgi:hypothetical protein
VWLRVGSWQGRVLKTLFLTSYPGAEPAHLPVPPVLAVRGRGAGEDHAAEPELRAGGVRHRHLCRRRQGLPGQHASPRGDHRRHIQQVLSNTGSNLSYFRRGVA